MSTENTVDETNTGGVTTNYDSKSSVGTDGQKVENTSKEAESEKIGNKENASQTKKPSITDQGNGTEEEIYQKENAIQMANSSSSDQIGKNENAGETKKPSIINHEGNGMEEGIYQEEETIQMGRSSSSDQDKKTKAGILLLVVAIPCIFALFISPPEPEMKSDFDLVTIFGNGVDELQQTFTNQTERFWMILKNRGLAHLRFKHPTQPLVFLLAAPPPAHEWVDCLATKLAEKLDPKRKSNLATIDGNQVKGNSADKTKEKMDEILEEKFKAGHRVALIHHLELLPPPSPLLFYSYCDDQNAPYKHVTIIFTVNLPDEPSSSLSPKEAEGIVEEYLANEVWSKVDKDAVSALLSRIATTVALMNGESTNSLNAYCS